MSDCCNNSCSVSNCHNTHRCPINGREYKSVSRKTILHHIKEPWHWHHNHQQFYFCEDPECDVVYFGQDDSVINKSELRTVVGIKDKSRDAMVCYCFGVTVAEADTNPSAKAFVIQETKGHECACEIRNPSGRCCLKDFTKS